MAICRKLRFTNYEDAILSGQRHSPKYKWKAYFCQTCLAYHNTRKRNHQGKGKPGRIQVLKSGQINAARADADKQLNLTTGPSAHQF